MAAIIFREGLHSLGANAGGSTHNASNGIQVGQWVFTGRPHVPYYDAEIVHIEEIADFSTRPQIPALNDADFQVELASGMYDFIVEGDQTAEVGDILGIRGTGTGAAISRVFAIDYEYSQLSPINAQNVGSGANIRLAFVFRGNVGSQFRVGQTISQGSFSSTILRTEFALQGFPEGETIVVTNSMAISTSVSNTDLITAHRQFQLFVFGPTASPLTGEINAVNVSLEEEGEHFSFIQNGHSNGPLYLTGGDGHLLVVPPGLEITANTLT